VTNEHFTRCSSRAHGDGQLKPRRVGSEAADTLAARGGCVEAKESVPAAETYVGFSIYERSEQLLKSLPATTELSTTCMLYNDRL
jgi:hypothetical protein